MDVAKNKNKPSLELVISRRDAAAAGLKHYFTGKPCKRGHIARRFVRSTQCMACNAEIARRRYQADPEAARARRKALYVLGSAKWVAATRYSASRRAARSGVPFDEEAVTEFLQDPPTHCPILGLEFRVGASGKTAATPESPTLDRVRPELGYVRGNLALISHRANMIKSNARPDEIRAVAQWLEATLKEQEAREDKRAA